MLDCEGNLDNELWFYAQSSFQDSPDDKTFNEVSKYRFSSNEHQLYFFEDDSFVKHDLDDVVQSFISCNNITEKTNTP